MLSTNGNVVGTREEVKQIGHNSRHSRAEQWGKFAPQIIGLAGKRPLVKNWTEWTGSPEYMAGLDAAGHNYGLLAASYPAVDVDVELAPLAAIARNLAREIIGPAPVRSRGDSPKCLLMYAAEPGALRKRRIEMRTQANMRAWQADPAVKADACVELLATGQQYVVAGRHPLGAVYQWDFQPDPWELTSLRPDAWDTYARTIADRFQRIAGVTVVKDGLGGALRTANTNRNAESLLAPGGPEQALEALRAWAQRRGDTHAEHMPHGEFVELCAAFRGATGDAADALFDEFRELLPGDRPTDDRTEYTY